MLLACIDESYTDELFFLGALVVDDDAACAIESGLDDLVAEYAEQFDVPGDAELHGHELFHGKGDWSGLSIRKLVNVYDRAMRVIGSAGASIAAGDDSCVVVVADEVHNQERHRTNFRSYRRDGTPGYRRSTLPHVLDTLHFGPSEHSRLLQAIDLVTFVHRRREAVSERDERARLALARMWSRVEPSVRFCSTWP